MEDKIVNENDCIEDAIVRCPFCGSEEVGWTNVGWGVLEAPGFAVRCTKCGAVGPSMGSFPAAVASWNDVAAGTSRSEDRDATEAVRKLVEPYSERIEQLERELHEFEPADVTGRRLHVGDYVTYSGGGETGVVEGFLLQVSVKLRDGRSVLDIGDELLKEDVPTLADVIDDLLVQTDAKSPEHFDIWLDEIREAVRREGRDE